MNYSTIKSLDSYVCDGQLVVFAELEDDITFIDTCADVLRCVREIRTSMVMFVFNNRMFAVSIHTTMMDLMDDHDRVFEFPSEVIECTSPMTS